MRLFQPILVAAVAFTAACTAGTGTTPRIRVAKDLGCTAERTTVARISEHRWQVEGCGKSAVYVCTYPVRDCWREGQVRSGSGDAAEPQPTAQVGR